MKQEEGLKLHKLGKNLDISLKNSCQGVINLKQGNNVSDLVIPIQIDKVAYYCFAIFNQVITSLIFVY